MNIYIIIEDRTNGYGNEDTSVMGTYKNRLDAVKELERIAENPINKTCRAGAVTKTYHNLGNGVRHVEDYYVHHQFESGFQSYRIEEHELK